MSQYISGHFKKIKFKRSETESLVFYLHYRVTFVILMVCCVVVTLNLIAGSPITCSATMEVIDKMMTSYCWSHSTYSVGSAYGKKVGQEIPYPGIDAYQGESDNIYRDYYQWVYLMLFIQGIFFYIPHAAWKTMENGILGQICENIFNPDSSYSDHIDATTTPTMIRENRLFAAAAFLHSRFGVYNKYAFLYWFCEIMAWANILLQTLFLDYVFQGEFLPLGLRAVEHFKTRNFYDSPLTWLFPRVTKCSFRKYARSGDVQRVDALCILPLNALNEKIYLFMWFWFAALFFLSSVGIFQTLLTVVSSKIRGIRLALQVASVSWPVSHQRGIAASRVGELTGYGDWFMLSILAKKMDNLDFKKFLSYILDRLNHPTEELCKSQ